MLIRVGAGHYAASVELPESLVDPVRNALRDLILPDEAEVPFQVVVEPLDEPDRYRISADGRIYGDGYHGEWIPDTLVRMLMLAELDATPDMLHLHGGLVSLAGVGVIVVGLSGAGKSTLVTGLASNGFDYCSDERVTVDPTSLIVGGFNKPISLVGGTWDVFPDIDPRSTGDGVATSTEWQVPASSLGAALFEEIEARLIVHVNWRPDGPVEAEILHPVESAGRLVADSPDAVRLGAEAVSLSARLAASVISVRLSYTHLSDAIAAIERSLTELMLPLTVEPLPVSKVSGDTGGAFDETSTLVLAAGVTAWMIGDRVIVHVSGGTEADQQIIELDSMSSIVVAMLDGALTFRRLVEELVAVGVDETQAQLVAMPPVESLLSSGIVAIKAEGSL